MAIQITLAANEFNHSGTYNDHKYTSICIKSISNGRIYFTTMRDGMRLSSMAKQMKLVDGNVIISFGKNDKLIIGTYTDDSIQEEVMTEQPVEVEDNGADQLDEHTSFTQYCTNCNDMTNHTTITTGTRIKTHTTTCHSCNHSSMDTEQYGIHYQDIRTESDFHKWASEYNDSSNLYYEVENNRFIYIYNKSSNYCSHRLNLEWYDKATILSICNQLSIEQRDYALNLN